MNNYVAIYIGHDGREYGFGRKAIIPARRPKDVMRWLVATEQVQTWVPENPIEQDEFDSQVDYVMSTYQKAGGGVYVAYSDEGTYIVTKVR